MTELETSLGFTEQDKARWMETNAWYYEDIEMAWAQKLQMHACPPRSAAVHVMPSYQSPVSGKWIDSPSQRRDDLAKTGSRPWEGMEAEQKEAARKTQEFDKLLDKSAESAAIGAWHSLSDESKCTLSNVS